jgi:hypothetical protein
MRPMRSWGRLLGICTVAWAFGPAMAFAAQDAVPRAIFRLEPEEIDADLFFNGAKIEVLGTILPGYEVAILCRGTEEHLALKRKGKAWGVLWMSVGDVAFEHLPSLYHLKTSAPLARLASPAVLKQLGIGYSALAVRAGKGNTEHPFFRELIKIKEKEGLFGVREGGAKLLPGAGGIAQVQAECVLPPGISMKEYEVQLFGFKEGKGELLCSKRIQVTQVGFTHFIASLVERRPLIHGFFAVAIAIAAGLLSGFVFGRSSRKPH